MKIPLLLSFLVCPWVSQVGLADPVAKAAETSPHVQAPRFNADGSLNLPEEYRRWVHIGTRLKPIGINILDGLQTKTPEIFNAYAEPSAMAAYQATGKWPQGSQLVKEFTAIKAGAGCDEKTFLCSSDLGPGIFETDYMGLGMMVKDAKRFPDAPGNWGFFSFGHHPPPYERTSSLRPQSQCAMCHIALASNTDFVIVRAHIGLSSR